VESQQKEDFIDATQNCLGYFGGAPKVIVPDNLKSAVTKANRYEPTLNQSFEEMANHYQMAVIPARSRRPRDKALVENAVRLVYQRVYAHLSEGPYHNLADVNAAIRDLLDAHNRATFQGGDDSRWDRFLARDKPELGPLPDHRYSIKKYARVTAQVNSHVLLSKDRHYYSIPYRFIGKKVKLSWDKRVVEVYFERKRIAFHLRNTERFGYTTTPSHLPSNHQHFLERSPGYYLNQGLKIGSEVVELFQEVFERRQHPEQGYKTCQGILSLERSYGRERLRKAAARSLTYGCFSYKCVRDILEKGLDQQGDHPQPTQAENTINDHDNIRGQEYYH
jgi:transposase